MMVPVVIYASVSVDEINFPALTFLEVFLVNSLVEPTLRNYVE